MLPDVSTTSSYAKRSRTDGQYLACKINLLANKYSWLFTGLSGDHGNDYNDILRAQKKNSSAILNL